MLNRKAISNCNIKILNIKGYKTFKGDIKDYVEKFVISSARKSLYSRSIFSDIIDYLDENKIALPDYNYLNTLIGKTIEFEMWRVGKIVQDNLDDTTHLLFENAFVRNDELYDIGAIKR